MRISGAASSEFELRAGDILSRQSEGPVRHFGVWIGEWGTGLAFGQSGTPLRSPLVAEGVLDIQKLGDGQAEVRLTDLETFSRGQDVHVERPKSVDFIAITARARQALAAGQVAYAALGDGRIRLNCEHLARWVATGDSQSRQADAGKTILIGAAVVAGLMLLGR